MSRNVKKEETLVVSVSRSVSTAKNSEVRVIYAPCGSVRRAG